MPIEAWTATTATIAGREVSAFGGCNYLGLSHHPRVLAAARRGLERFGLSTTASRETTGNTVAHESLERELAAFTGLDAAILTPEGYTANLALGQALSAEYPVALIDEKSHRSVHHMARAAGMHVATFRHRDAPHLARVLAEHAPRADGRVAVMTDGVFAADGAVAPLAEIARCLPDRGLLVVDDCHGFCVLGARGRGACEHFAIPADERLCITTTLAKGLGCYGGAVLGTPALVRRVREVGGVYRGTTPAPPAAVEAAREALRVLAEEPAMLERLRENVARARRMLGRAAPPDAAPPVPIMTFTLGAAERMESAERALLDAGFLVPLIDYPGGPAPRYFRLTVSAAHTASQLEGLSRAIRATMGDAIAPALPAVA